MSYFPSYQRPGYQLYNSFQMYPANHSGSNVNLHQYMPMTPNADYMIPSNLMNSPGASPQITNNKSLLTLSSLNNDNTLDQLNISRTVVIRNINEDIELTDLLDNIDYGPIEYVKIFAKPAHKSFEKIDQSVKNFKVCFISFINSKVSINFTMKYQNSDNLSALKDRLNSKYLKINLNDNKIVNNGMKDYIKLKTLNYIVEFNATRAVSILLRYPTKDFDLLLYLDSLKQRLTKIGDFEHFKTVEVDHFDVLDSESDDDVNDENYKILDIQVHFTSIDLAVRCYENFCRQIQNKKPDADNNDISFIGTKFIQDRCERVTDFKNLNDKTKRSILESPNLDNELVLMPQGGINMDFLPPSLLKDNLDTCSDNINSVSDDEDEDNSVFFNYPNASNNSSILNLSSLSFQPQPPMTPNTSMPPHMYRPPPGFPQRRVSNPMMYSPYPNQPYAPSPNASLTNIPIFESQYQPIQEPYNNGNRTIYLGNLHPQSTVEEIANNVRAGGLVESIKFYPEKRNCFITFIDANVAHKFFMNHQVLHQLIIHGYDITVGWAKSHSGPLPRDIALAVTAGASRNVYIGIKMNRDSEGNPVHPTVKPRLPGEEELRADFSAFGELEQINFYHNNDCGFLNFINIADAIKLVELFDQKDEARISMITKNPNFYQKYQEFKISFGKDRCGNPPKFSFKKKVGRSRQKIYFDEAAKRPEKAQISDEAAMVFGIIRDDGNETRDVDEVNVDEVDVDIKEEPVDSLSPKLTTEDSNKTKGDVKPQGQFSEDVLDAADDEEDDEDDDDISIIIGSDDTSSTLNNGSGSGSGSGSNGKPNKMKKKFYSNVSNTSETFIPVKNGKSKPQAGPYMPQAPPGFVPHQPQQNQGPPSYQYGGPPVAGYMNSPGGYNYNRPQYNRRNSSNYSYNLGQTGYGFQGGIPGSPMQGGPVFVPPPGPQQFYYEDNSPVRNSFNGSTVMAQYLAKSQSDNLMYQPQVVYEMDERRRKK